MRLALLRSLALLGLTIGFAGCTAPVASPPPPPAEPAPAPEWRHTSTRDYERDFPGKGLGVSRRYDSEDGWTDVTIYDLGHTWADGCDDPEFAMVFNSACDDIRAAGRTGYYSDLQSELPQSGTAGPLPIRWARFTFRHQGKKIESYLIMTCAHGRLIKARASLFVPASEVARQSVLALVQQQIRLIQ